MPNYNNIWIDNNLRGTTTGVVVDAALANYTAFYFGRSQFDVARILSSVDDHRANRGTAWVVDIQSAKTEPAAEFFAGILRPWGRGSRRDHSGRQQRVFNISPAIPRRFRMRPATGNFRGANHPRIIFDATRTGPELTAFVQMQSTRPRFVVK